MIEAVNSVLSNVSASRGVVDQQSTARSPAANPDKIQEVAKTPYISPYISIDRQSNRAVLQIRDSDTGDVVRQFPTEGQLKAYRTAQEFSERQKAITSNQVSQATGSSASSSSSAPSVPVAADVAAPAAPSSQPAPAAPSSSAPVTSVQTEA